MMFQVEILCVMTPCSVMVGYQTFRGSYFFHLQDNNTQDLEMIYSLQVTTPANDALICISQDCQPNCLACYMWYGLPPTE